MNKPDERLVYLALRSVFSGDDAKIRSVKAIRKQIRNHEQKEDVKALMNSHNQAHVYNAVKELLESHVFESTLHAKVRFPEVFSISPAQSADREQSEEAAARSEANAIKNAAEGHLDNLGPTETNDESVNQAHGRIEFETQPTLKYSQKHSALSLPSLYPIYLPFETQHRLLKRVQDVLENSCYAFVRKTLSETLERNGYDCPERVELNIWARILKQTQFSKENIGGLGRPFGELMESIVRLRHTAVHRVEISANRVLEFLIDSEQLATLLEDDNAATRITRLRGALELATDEIKRNKEFLNFRATKTIRDLNNEIGKLKRLQEVAIDEMLSEDKTFRRLAVADLDIVMDIKASKQHNEGERGYNALSEMEDILESSSDVEIEGEK